MTETTEQRCATCRFYSTQKCRRYPPKHHPNSNGWATFPMVQREDWCGEWQFKGDAWS